MRVSTLGDGGVPNDKCLIERGKDFDCVCLQGSKRRLRLLHLYYLHESTFIILH